MIEALLNIALVVLIVVGPLRMLLKWDKDCDHHDQHQDT